MSDDKILTLHLTRPIASLDVESTGPDPATDHIITLDVVRVQPNGTREHKGWMFNPGVPIPPGATEVHGITDEMVHDLSPFNVEACLEFEAFIYGCDITGFNLFKFDIPIYLEETNRIGAKDLRPFPPVGALILDSHIIFRNKEPRDLSAAVQKYCGRSHESAHNSRADADAAFDVLVGQTIAYPDLAQMSLADLAKYSAPENMVDFAGKLSRDKDGDVIYNIGKAKGSKVKNDPGFGYWMLNKDFTSDTKKHLRAALEECGAL